MMRMVEIHADDYALTENTSREMTDLIREGILDGISVIVNSLSSEECYELFLSAIPDFPFVPKISVHLDLVEGIRLSDAGTSYITDTWSSLFLSSFIPFYRQKVKQQLKAEIAAQIEEGMIFVNKCADIALSCNVPFNGKGLRIDSHQHTHMIPVVWSALTEVIDEKGYEVDYIRNSKEPIMPFVGRFDQIKSFRPANVVKNRLLSVLSHPVDRYYKKYGHRPMYLWGLMMSGRMDALRITTYYDAMKEKADKDGRDLEILFHPGKMTGEELCRGIPQKSADDFYLSDDRDIEKEGARKCRQLTNVSSV